jgi:WD40 repeat protein
MLILFYVATRTFDMIQCCREWQRALQDDCVWERLCRSHLELTTKRAATWHDEFRDMYNVGKKWRNRVCVEHVLEAHTDFVSAVQFVDDNTKLVSVSSDGHCMIWSMADFSRVSDYTHSDAPQIWNVVKRDNYIFLGSRGYCVLDYETGQLVHSDVRGGTSSATTSRCRS